MLLAVGFVISENLINNVTGNVWEIAGNAVTTLGAVSVSIGQ